jgi:hypothetical protein
MATMAETRPRTMGAVDRFSSLSGVLAVACWVIGLFVMESATNDDKGPQILANYKNHDQRILAGTVIWLIGTALFVWWLGHFRNRLLAAEGPAGRLTAVAFAGGIAAAICLALSPGGDAAGALGKDDVDASASLALHNIGTVFFFGAEYLLPVMLVATAVIALRTGVLPKWLAWVTLLVALVLFIGPIGWAALIFAFPIWVLIVTFLFWREPAAARSAV